MATKKAPARKPATKRKRTARKPAAAAKLKPEPHWLNKGQVAKGLGISVQAFDKWGVEPVAQRHKFGEAFYALRDIVEFCERRAAERERKKYERYVSTDPGDSPAEILLAKEKAELRWTEERAEGQRLRNAELRRELAPVEMLTWALSDLASQMAPLLTPIPGEIKRRIPKITNSELHVMREIIANALNLVAEVRLDFDAYEPDGEQAGD